MPLIKKTVRLKLSARTQLDRWHLPNHKTFIHLWQLRKHERYPSRFAWTPKVKQSFPIKSLFLLHQLEPAPISNGRPHAATWILGHIPCFEQIKESNGLVLSIIHVVAITPNSVTKLLIEA